MRPVRGRPRSIRLLAGIAALAAIDLLTKLWASRSLVDVGIELPGPVDLRLSHNSGIAFGAYDDLPAPVIVLLTAAVSIALVIAGVRGAVPPWPCALIAGGVAVAVWAPFAARIEREKAGSKPIWQGT